MLTTYICFVFVSVLAGKNIDNVFIVWK